MDSIFGLTEASTFETQKPVEQRRTITDAWGRHKKK